MRILFFLLSMLFTINVNAQQLFLGIDVSGLSYNELCKRIESKGYKLRSGFSECSTYEKVSFESFPDCDVNVWAKSSTGNVSSIVVTIFDNKKNNKVHSDPFVWLSHQLESQYGKCQEERNDGYYLTKTWNNTSFERIILQKVSGIKKNLTVVIFFPR